MQNALRDESFTQGHESFDLDRFRNVLLLSSRKSMDDSLLLKKRISAKME